MGNILMSNCLGNDTDLRDLPVEVLAGGDGRRVHVKLLILHNGILEDKDNMLGKGLIIAGSLYLELYSTKKYSTKKYLELWDLDHIWI